MCLCVDCRDEAGALYRLLSHFAFHHINMTRIESRPIPQKTWKYRFFIDFEGNLADPGVQSVLAGITDEASGCRILGTC